jgi:hypothetical protein
MLNSGTNRQGIAMWVTLELDPITNAWVPIGTTHFLGRIRRFWSVVIPETLWPIGIAVTVILVGILAAVWSYPGDSEAVISSASNTFVEVSNVDKPEMRFTPEPSLLPTPTIVIKNSGGEAPKKPTANANLWLTNSPPVSDYRSVSAGNWLSE